MARITVMFELEETVLQQLQGIATEARTDVGALVRQVIARDLQNRSAQAKAPAKTQGPVTDALLAEIADDMKTAQTWSDLRARLAARGVVLRRRDGGLALVRLSDDSTICDTSDLGVSVARLVQRFGVRQSHDYATALPAVAPLKA